MTLPKHLEWGNVTLRDKRLADSIHRWLTGPGFQRDPKIPCYVLSQISHEPNLLAFLNFLANPENDILKSEIHAMRFDPDFDNRLFSGMKILNRLEKWRKWGSYLQEDTKSNTA
jgi:hypothetical protein